MLNKKLNQNLGSQNKLIQGIEALMKRENKHKVTYVILALALNIVFILQKENEPSNSPEEQLLEVFCNTQESLFSADFYNRFSKVIVKIDQCYFDD